MQFAALAVSKGQNILQKWKLLVFVQKIIKAQAVLRQADNGKESKKHFIF